MSSGKVGDWGPGGSLPLDRGFLLVRWDGVILTKVYDELDRQLSTTIGASDGSTNILCS